MAANENQRIFKKFGKYFLLERIAQGGMAEIYLARYAVPDSGSRLMAIKCLLTELEHAETISNMFRSEVKILLALSHPSIVQFYDFGDGSGTKLNGRRTPYIAMEYLSGQSLRKAFISLKKKTGEMDLLPVGLIYSIIDQCCRALHYVHNFRDPLTDQALNIIHRDVTPQNIILQFDGTVKLIDFGVAKVSGWSGEATATGVIKGTPAYLSPEQARAEGKIDHRSDQFSLGIVLWEMLTGKRLFRSDTTRITLDRICESHKHVSSPSKYRAGLGPEMDFVVMRSLAHNPSDRFATMEDFRIGLRNASKAMGVDPDQNDLGALLRTFMDKSFGQESRTERRRIQALNEEAESVIRTLFTPDENTQVSQANSKSGVAASHHPVNEAQIKMPGSRVDSLEMVQSKTDPGTPQPHQPKSNQKKRTVVEMEPGAPVHYDRAPSERGKIELEPDRHAVHRNGKRKRSRRLQRWLSRARSAALWIAFLVLLGAYFSESSFKVQTKRSEGFFALVRYAMDTVILAPLPKPKENPVVEAIVEKKPIAPGALNLEIEITPPGRGTVIKLGGKFVNPQFPRAAAEVKAGDPIDVSVTRPGYDSQTLHLGWNDLVLINNSEPELGRLLKVRLNPTHYGLLTVKTSVSAEITLRIDGQAWRRTDAIENERLLPGPIEIELVNQMLGRHRFLKSEIHEGRITMIETDLSKAGAGDVVAPPTPSISQATATATPANP